MTDGRGSAKKHIQTHQAEDSGQYNLRLFSERNIYLNLRYTMSDEQSGRQSKVLSDFSKEFRNVILKKLVYSRGR